MTDSPAPSDDFELLDAWARGDTGAARDLLRRYTGPLTRFFDRKVEGPIEDMVQDTFEACIAGRDRFRREAGFRSYVFGIARHILFAHLRAKHRSTGELDLEASCMADLSSTPSRLLEHKRERRLLLEALRLLPVETQVLCADGVERRVGRGALCARVVVPRRARGGAHGVDPRLRAGHSEDRAESSAAGVVARTDRAVCRSSAARAAASSTSSPLAGHRRTAGGFVGERVDVRFSVNG